MQLLIDVGNSRVKWAVLEGENLGPQQTLERAALEQDDLFADLRHVERVLVSNVGGTAAAKRLRELTTKHFRVEPEFIGVEAEAFGVTNAYARANQLGVDRWIALIAAYRLTRDLVCVVDAGTAVTVDAVDPAGHHLGGLIAPGLRLMMQSLAVHTSDIDSVNVVDEPGVMMLAKDTGSAVRAGARFASAGLVERVVTTLEQRFGKPPRVLLTGGDAERLRAALSQPAENYPDLVLRGLVIYAGANR